MNRSSVIDSFFGAFLGFWVIMVISSRDKPIMEDWTFLIILPFIAVTMWLLNRANSAKIPKDRYINFGFAIPASLFSSFVLQIIMDGKIGINAFAAQPRTWFLFCLVSAWFVSGGIFIKRNGRT